MSNKMEEGLEHIKAAEKYLKTGFMKWKPDYDSAADEYSQAAQCFRIMRNHQKSKECHLLASDCYKNNKSFFHAGKSIENAIIAGKEITSPEEIYKLAEMACSLYQQHGSGDSGANVLDKAGKIINEQAPELALQLYQHAADVSSGETTSHQAAEYISKASRILVKLGMYDQAVDSIRREIGYHQQHDSMGPIGRLTVALVLVQLARGDTVAAEKAYREWGNCCEVPEAQTLEILLDAFNEEDPQGARAALSDPFIRHMDIEYAKLATTIPLPEGIANMPFRADPHSVGHGDNEKTSEQVYQASAAPAAAASTSSAAPEPNAEDEDDSELC